jgi:hypothetical protein
VLQTKDECFAGKVEVGVLKGCFGGGKYPDVLEVPLVTPWIRDSME